MLSSSCVCRRRRHRRPRKSRPYFDGAAFFAVAAAASSTWNGRRKTFGGIGRSDLEVILRSNGLRFSSLPHSFLTK